MSLADITTTGSQLIKYTIRYPDGLSSSFTTSDASAYMVRVNIGELNTRTVDVKAEIVGSVAEGYTAGELLLSPAQLEIRGQPEDIDPVSYAKVTINPTMPRPPTPANWTTSSTIRTTSCWTPPVSTPPWTRSRPRCRSTSPRNSSWWWTSLNPPGARASNLNYTIEPESITVCGDAGKAPGRGHHHADVLRPDQAQQRHPL